ncbi:alpha/beta fold hydrolase [Deinococcus hopiensis]|uniref:Pimeloyl-ACP methyl ester carboxylesterase n=1 Tax=Deinococcus hopiensis KR-140 TaxID=695939 RepID=A0A1W1UDX1_9DEIO|nr:alpha/beta hydrolase [Deinococcus hopiensis]SMB79277.1 Pimeloyl-ACP methyl ester carboxylesterase [Deinococcus hopiensis KR-140]
MTSLQAVPHTALLTPDLPLTLTEAGAGRSTLILHGGGGPLTVTGLAAQLSTAARTLLPTHPGWNGTPRPEHLARVRDLARVYLQLLEDRQLRDVLVVGSSLGGWIGAEMALADSGRRITGLVLINAVGVKVEGEPIQDVFALSPRGLAELSFHAPDRFFVDPANLTQEQVARQKGNLDAMRRLAGEPYMHDPTLLGRLCEVSVPTLVLWGESDRIVTPAYGAAYAAAFRQGQFEVIPRAGHLPQLERPEATLAQIDHFMAKQARQRE